MAKLFSKKSDASQVAEEVKSTEFMSVDFDTILYKGEKYYIKPTICFTVIGEPYPCYGIFNKTTHIMESDTRQYPAALQWVRALDDLDPDKLRIGSGFADFAPEMLQ